MELDPQDVRDFGEAVRGLDTLLDHVKSERTRADLGSAAAQSGNITLSVYGASGWALRLMVTLGIVMFTMLCASIGFNVYSAVLQGNMIRDAATRQDQAISKIDGKVDRQQDYLNVILQWAPELRSKVEKIKKDQAK